MSVIKRSDLITDEAFNWPKEYQKDLEGIITTSKKLGSGGAKKNVDELTKVQRQLSVATDRSTKEYIEQKAALNTLNKTTREAVKDVQNLDNSYDRLSKELNDTRRAYKNLAAVGKENTTIAKNQLAQIRKLDTQLKKIDNTVGQNQRSVGKYSNALKGVTARFIGWAAAGALVFKALKSGIKIVLDYTKANSTLNAILNKTSKETKELRKQQLELGKATAFSATQVTKAQTELARLGLTMEEITALTPAILDAAVAFGVDMAQAAELVAGQLNAFNLSAREGKRVADVLTRATQISAFNFQRLQDALKVVSPAANAVNATIEDTVGVLTAAVDANIDASTAATALRNIYIDLADNGITWDDAMQQINTSTNKLSTANELFGKRGAVVGTVIADNTLKINENTKALENAAGTAQKFADEQLDNLSGDLVLLTSAWEGFILSLEKGDGVLARVGRNTIQFFTSALGAMNRAAEGTTLEFELWKERMLEVNDTNEKLNQTLFALVNLSNQAKDSIDDVNKSMAENRDIRERIDNLRMQIDFIKQVGKERAALLDAETKKIEEEEAKRQVIRDAANAEILAEKAKINELLKDLSAQGVEDERSAFLKEVELRQGSIDTIKSIEQKLADDLKEINKQITEADEAAAKERTRIADQEAKDKIEAEELVAETRKNIQDAAFDLAAESANRFTDLRIQQISQELTALEFARDRELQQFEGNARKQEEINKKFDSERRKLQKEQAIAEKQNALFQIALNTAVSIIKTGAQLGYPAAIPFVAFAAAAGAIQAAAVLAAPVPEFDEGTKNTPSDYIAGEKRPELRKSNGQWSLVDKPTLFGNSKGDTIIGGQETDSILGTMADLTGKNLLSDPDLITGLINNDFKTKKRQSTDLARVIIQGNKAIIGAIKGKTSVNISVSNSRTNITEKVGNTRRNRLDAYYRGRI